LIKQIEIQHDEISGLWSVLIDGVFAGIIIKSRLPELEPGKYDMQEVTKQ